MNRYQPRISSASAVRVCQDKVRAKCARGEKKDCEVMELRKALAKE